MNMRFVDHHGIPDDQLIRDTSSNVGGKPFGWAHEEERAAIRRELIASGMAAGTPELHFAVVKEQERRHQFDLTFRQRQDLARWLGLPWAGGAARNMPRFTAEELAEILDRFRGANNDIGYAIAEKAKALLAAKTPTTLSGTPAPSLRPGSSSASDQP